VTSAHEVGCVLLGPASIPVYSPRTSRAHGARYVAVHLARGGPKRSRNSADSYRVLGVATADGDYQLGSEGSGTSTIIGRNSGRLQVDNDVFNPGRAIVSSKGRPVIVLGPH
jgi:hypothetical protein